MIWQPKFKKDELECFYLEKKLSTRKIAKIFKCSQTYIVRHMHHYDIPLRTISETNKIRKMPKSYYEKKSVFMKKLPRTKEWNENIRKALTNNPNTHWKSEKHRKHMIENNPSHKLPRSIIYCRACCKEIKCTLNEIRNGRQYCNTECTHDGSILLSHYSVKDCPMCECGCGNRVRLPKHRFVHGHSNNDGFKHLNGVVWNKGLTKETNASLKRMSDNRRRA
ncbi:unnamed protein product, partial [marine sediment metagenome]